METKANNQVLIKKSTFANKLQKEIANRKTDTGLIAILTKLNPFASANK